jgi:hypothetical protein
MEMPIDADKLKEQYEFWKERDKLVNLSTLATALGLSPNHLSELVGIGALEYVSRKPLHSSRSITRRVAIANINGG